MGKGRKEVLPSAEQVSTYTGTINGVEFRVEVKFTPIDLIPFLIQKLKDGIDEIQDTDDETIFPNLEIFDYKGNKALVFNYDNGTYTMIDRNDDFCVNTPDGLKVKRNPEKLLDYEWKEMDYHNLEYWWRFFKQYPGKYIRLHQLECLIDTQLKLKKKKVKPDGN